MNAKSRTNGFGSFIVDIKVVVNKPHHQLFIDDGWTVSEETTDTAVFNYSCGNQYRGDDETIVCELYADVPKGLSYDQFHIDWENSVY